MTTPPPDAISHYVFVDFENVPSVDLAPLAGLPARVTLLIGEKQRRLDLALVQQIHRLADQITLIEVGASGRNALDLVLAAHLGRATQQYPTAEFTIISKDKDFDPLITHLRTREIRVSRVPDVASLPMLAPKHSHPSTARPASGKKTKALPATAAPVAFTNALNPRMQKLVFRLTSHAGPHPRSRDRLLRHIAASFGPKLSEPQQTEVLEALIARGIVTIDANDNASYPLTAVDPDSTIS